MNKRYPIQMEIAGNYAMWTRPDTGDSPISYPAPTYSAVKGIFESILWGPAIEIIPKKVEICSPIKYHSYATNYGGPLRKSKLIKEGNQHQMFATVLIDVCYRLYADVVEYTGKNDIPEKAKEWANNTTSPGHAYKDIFERRLNNGQAFSVPFLGWKTFTPTYFGPFRKETRIYKEMGDVYIPSMIRTVFSEGYNSEVSYEYDTNIIIKEGILKYPERR